MSKVRLYGSTSGYIELAAPAVAPDTTLTLPPTLAGIGTNVVQVVKSDQFTSTATGWNTVTGLTANITPSSATSKILVVAQVAGASTQATSGSALHLRLDRNGTTLDVGTTTGSRIASTASIGTRETGTTAIIMNTTIMLLDNPASSSARTYTVEFNRGSAGTVYINRTEQDFDSAGTSRPVSTLTLIEVAA